MLKIKKEEEKEREAAQPSPDRITEAINQVVGLLAYKFRFGYHDVEDMKQQGALFAMQFLRSGKYDAARPLENILYTHLRNQFINYKRDNYMRNESPCKKCPFYDKAFRLSTNQCAEFPDKRSCEKFEKWRLRNMAKQNLMKPVDIEQCSSASYENKPDEDTDTKLFLLIEDLLPMELRSDYLKLKDGVAIPKLRKDKVIRFIREAVANAKREED